MSSSTCLRASALLGCLTSNWADTSHGCEAELGFSPRMLRTPSQTRLVLPNPFLTSSWRWCYSTSCTGGTRLSSFLFLLHHSLEQEQEPPNPWHLPHSILTKCNREIERCMSLKSTDNTDTAFLFFFFFQKHTSYFLFYYINMFNLLL